MSPDLVLVVLLVLVLLVLVLLVVPIALKIVKQYEEGVLFRLGRVIGQRAPGLRVIVSYVDVLHRVSRIVTMPVQSQGIITPATSAWTCRPRAARLP